MIASALYIKSHTMSPDWESEVETETIEEAVNLFYNQLQGEFDKKWIEDNMGYTMICDKCGGEAGDTLIGDESYVKCGDCGFITA